MSDLLLAVHDQANWHLTDPAEKVATFWLPLTGLLACTYCTIHAQFNSLEECLQTQAFIST